MNYTIFHLSSLKIMFIHLFLVPPLHDMYQMRHVFKESRFQN